MDGNGARPARRSFLKRLARLAGAGAASRLAPLAAFAAAPRALAQAGSSGAAGGGAPQPRGTRLVLLGTRAGPGVDLSRAQTGSAVVVDGVPYLVDCGYGTVRALVASGIGLQRIGTVFLTHLHNDHTTDLAALLSFQWTDSREQPTDVYGPYGTATLVEGALAFFGADVEIRMVDEGRTIQPETLFHGHDVPATAKPAQVYEDGRVTVSSIENTHFPERSRKQMPYRSLAYRFDTAERSIVFSGDTAYSSNLVELARGADLFVCEIIDRGNHARQTARAEADAKAGHPVSIARHVAETHSPPADVGRMAAEAGVETVVLNHQLAGSRTPEGLDFPVSTYVDDVRETFSGEVIVGRDLMVL